MKLEFTPLEFETDNKLTDFIRKVLLEFTPLEFETTCGAVSQVEIIIRIYSVGV